MTAASLPAGDARSRPGSPLPDLALVLAVTTLSTVLGLLFEAHSTNTDRVLLFLLGTVLVAGRVGRWAAVVHAALGVFAFNYFFVEPRWTLHVEDSRFLFTFLVMLVLGLAVSHLAFRLRQEAALAAEARVATDRERTRSALLAAVSHDLRTPLATISGAAEVLLDDARIPADGDSRALLGTIRAESERLSRFVSNLLDLTRVGSDSFRPSRERVPLEEVVSSAVERTRPLFGDRSIEVAMPESIVEAFVDPVLLEHVIVNLLENAARHAPSTSPVRITVSGTEAAAVIEIRDRGPGPAGILAALRRTAPGGGPAGAGATTQGTGLGLAVCAAVMRVHGGTIDAFPAEGGGSIVRLELPSSDRPVEGVGAP